MAEETDIYVVETSPLNKHTFEFQWKIHDFDIVIEDKNMLNEQVFNLVGNKVSDFPTEWSFHLQAYEIRNSRDRIIDEVIRIIMKPKKPELFRNGDIMIMALLTIPNVNGTVGDFVERRVARFVSQNDSWYWNDLFSRTYSVRKLPLENGSLKINFQLRLHTKKIQSPCPVLSINSKESWSLSGAFNTFQKETQNKLLENLITLIETERLLHDFKIISSSGKEYSVIKRMFTVKSPVFAAMFNSQMKEGRMGILEIKDLSDEMLELLVNYVQSGKLPQDIFSKVEGIIDVAYIAEKYELSELHLFCDDILSRKWDKLNADVFRKSGLIVNVETD